MTEIIDLRHSEPVSVDAFIAGDCFISDTTGDIWMKTNSCTGMCVRLKDGLTAPFVKENKFIPCEITINIVR